jgi:hypothetical protein
MQLKTRETNIHALSGIRTHSLAIEHPQTYALRYGNIGARTDTTQEINICLGMWLLLMRHACPDFYLQNDFFFSVCLLQVT